jgi:hypothetical protein
MRDTQDERLHPAHLQEVRVLSVGSSERSMALGLQPGPAMSWKRRRRRRRYLNWLLNLALAILVVLFLLEVFLLFK